jgi:hypothetical protein
LHTRPAVPHRGGCRFFHGLSPPENPCRQQAMGRPTNRTELRMAMRIMNGGECAPVTRQQVAPCRVRGGTSDPLPETCMKQSENSRDCTNLGRRGCSRNSSSMSALGIGRDMVARSTYLQVGGVRLLLATLPNPMSVNRAFSRAQSTDFARPLGPQQCPDAASPATLCRLVHDRQPVIAGESQPDGLGAPLGRARILRISAAVVFHLDCLPFLRPLSHLFWASCLDRYWQAVRPSLRLPSVRVS